MTNKNLLAAMNIKPNDISFGEKKALSNTKHLSLGSASAKENLSQPSKAEELEAALKAKFSKTHANKTEGFEGSYDSEDKRYKY